MTNAAELRVLLTGDASGANAALDGFGSAVGGIGKLSKGLGLGIAGAVGSGVAALGGLGVAGMNAASQMLQGQQNLQAQLGITEEMAAKLGGVATDVFKNNWGGSIEEVTTAVGQLTQAFDFDIASEQLQAVTQDLYTIQDAFDLPIEESTKALGIMAASFGDLAVEPQKFGDMMTRVLQTSGANADDLLETIGEYSPLMEQMGMSSEQFFGVLQSGLAAGARDTDFVADLFKEFGIRITDGSDATQGALDALNLGNLTAEISAGQITGVQAFDQIQAAIGGLDDPILKNQIGVALMGTKFEDLGQDVVAALDTGPLTNFEGKTADAGNSIYNNLGAAVDGIKRSFTVGLGEAFLPLMESAREALPGLMGAVLPAIDGVMAGVKDALGKVDVAAIFTQIGDAIKGVDWAGLGAQISGVVSTIADKLATFDWAGLASTVGGVFGKIGDVIGFLANNPAIAMIVGALAGIVAAVAPIMAIVGPLIPLFGGLVTALGGGAAIMGALGAAFTVLTGPIGIAIAAIIGLKLAWDNNLFGIQEKAAALKEALAGAFQRIQEVIASAVDSIKGKIAEVKDWIVSHKDLIINALLLLMGPIGVLAVIWREKGDEIKAVIADLKDRFVAWVTDLVANATKLKDDVVGAFTDLWDSITGIMTGLRDTVADLWAQLAVAVSGYLDDIKKLVVGAWNAYWDTIQKGMKVIWDVITTAWDGIMLAIDSVLQIIAGIVHDAWDGIKTAIDTVLGIIRGIIDGALSGWQRIFDTAMGAIQGVVDKVFGANSGISLVIKTATDFIHGIFDTLRLFISGDFSGAFTTLKTTVEGAINGLRDAIDTGIAQAVQFFQPILDKINELTGIDLEAVGKAIVDGLAAGIRSAFEGLQGAVTALANLLPQWIKDALGIHSPSQVFRNIGEMIVKGLELGLERLPGMWDDKVIKPLQLGVAEALQIARLYENAAIMPPGQSAAGGLFGASTRMPFATREMTGKGLTGSLGPSIMELIKSLDWANLQPQAFDKILKGMGIDDETRAGLRDLHKMRDAKGWLTPEARELFRRRQMPRQGRPAGTSLTGGEWIDINSIAPPGSVTPVPVSPGGLRNPSAAPMEVTATKPLAVKLDSGKIDGRFELSDKLVVKVVIGQREITQIAQEVVRIIEGSLKVKSSPGMP